MQIEYVATGHRREVSETIGLRLVKARIARAVVYETRDVRPSEEISPRTGKAKRKYSRRDMVAED